MYSFDGDLTTLSYTNCSANCKNSTQPRTPPLPFPLPKPEHQSRIPHRGHPVSPKRTNGHKSARRGYLAKREITEGKASRRLFQQREKIPQTMQTRLETYP